MMVRASALELSSPSHVRCRTIGALARPDPPARPLTLRRGAVTLLLDPRTPWLAGDDPPPTVTARRPGRLLSAQQAVGLCGAWMVVVTAVLVHGATTTSWHVFADAAGLVFSRTPASSGGGLAVYAVHPRYQFGPFSIVVAEAIHLLALGHDQGLAVVPMGVLAPVLLWLVLDARRLVVGRPARLRPAPTLILTGGFALVWSLLSVSAMHLDDALAVTLAAAALWGVARGSAMVVGVGLGLAAASKPWALAFFPLVLALPAPRRVRATSVAVGIVAALWLPFVVGARGTVAALGRFTIVNQPNSGLRALHVLARRTPRWDRGAQLLLGGGVAAWCARTGRWPAALMGAAALRLAIDPGTNRYYATGIVALVAAWEVITARWPVPWASIATAVALIAPTRLPMSSMARADLRLGTCLALVALAVSVAGPRRASSEEAHRGDEAVHPTPRALGVGR